jgi:eukaryotic-like serine/threonine-protein kinase
MPSADPTADFLTAINLSGLLTPTQLGELTRWARESGADPVALTKEAARLGWLTLYQAREIYRGRAKNLLIGPFVLQELLGEGGMGRVYKAQHTMLGRDVALKVIRQEKLSNASTLARFHKEIEAVAHLSHPNVVLAFDAASADGTHYLAMEFVDGQDLTKIVKDRGALPYPEACEYIRQAALGLQHAHERGLVHRDVKPSNIMVAKTGQVKVLDLGLALLNDPPDGPTQNRITLDGFVIGTPDFLAPEQARDPQRVDIRADIYALGATLYYLLTGQPPYDGATPTEKLMKHCTDPPPEVLRLQPHLPPQLDAIIKWLMAKEPQQRAQTPLDVVMAMVPFCTPGSAPQAAAVAMPNLDAGFESNVLFRLPRGETAARVREKQVKSGAWRGWLVGGLGVLVMATIVFVGYTVLQRSRVAAPPTTEYTNAIGMKFKLIPAGTFTLGSPEREAGRRNDEGPATEIKLTQAYYIALTEVTNAQFTQVMGQSPAWTVGRVLNSRDLPVESVNWDEAVVFCRKLNDRDTTRRDGWAYRLPTEAQWEYACRAGTKTPFHVGEQLSMATHKVTITPDERADGADDAPPKAPTMPNVVGKSLANVWGLYDCHGNVAEWCGDYFARSYAQLERTNPTGPTSGDVRVVRGGGYDSVASKCRSAARRGLPPETRDRAIGFRVVLAPVPSSD